MFREIQIYDDFTKALSSPGGWFCLGGLNLILLGTLIIFFPKLLAWLVAMLLIFSGVVLLAVAWQFRRFNKLYHQWREFWWSP